MTRLVFNLSPKPPESDSGSLEALYQQVVGLQSEAGDRRSHPRCPITVQVTAMEVDTFFKPLNTEFRAMTRDISAGGISLVHTGAVNSKYLAVELPIKAPGQEQLRQIVIEVLRCRQVGDSYEIGGKFVSELA